MGLAAGSSVGDAHRPGRRTPNDEKKEEEVVVVVVGMAVTAGERIDGGSDGRTGAFRDILFVAPLDVGEVVVGAARDWEALHG